MFSNSKSKQNIEHVTIYTTQFCPYCVAAKQLLKSKGIGYDEIDVGGDPQKRAEMEKLSHRRTVPQIFSEEIHIGGYTDLVSHLGR